MRKLSYVFAMVAASLASTAASADVATGLDLFERGRFDEAAAELSPDAKAGDAEAQYLLAIIYLNEMAVPPDETIAVDMLRSAGEKGHLAAQTELARMYRTGDGVQQDFQEMMRWYAAAAEQGDVGAQLFLADSYAYGMSGEPDLIEAYKWYEIAIRYWGSLAVRARDVIGEQMTKDQIAEAVRRAGDWLSDHPNP